MSDDLDLELGHHPQGDERFFGDHELCEDEPWENADDYEDGFEDIEVSAEDFERRRIA